MSIRTLGKSPLEIGEMGLGCWAIGGPFHDNGGWIGYGDIDDAEALRAIRRALDLGIRFFDTSNVYGCGHSERLLGEALKGTSEGVVLSTKFGFLIDEANRHVLGQDASPEAIRESCEDSLKRLNREVIELFTFQLWDWPLEQIDEVILTLNRLIEAGKILSYTWLTDDLPRVRGFYEKAAEHVFCAPQLMNLFEENPDLIAFGETHDLTICTRRPLQMGLLTGKFTAESSLAENDMRKRFGWNFAEGSKQRKTMSRLEKLKEVLTRGGHTLAQGCLAWIRTRTAQGFPLPGFRNVKQVEENVGSVAKGKLTAEQMREIAELKG